MGTDTSLTYFHIAQCGHHGSAKQNPLVEAQENEAGKKRIRFAEEAKVVGEPKDQVTHLQAHICAYVPLQTPSCTTDAGNQAGSGPEGVKRGDQ